MTSTAKPAAPTQVRGRSTGLDRENPLGAAGAEDSRCRISSPGA